MPTLQDVFRYDQTLANKPGDMSTSFGYYSQNPDAVIQDLIDQGIISQIVQEYSNESGAGTIATNQVDWSRLPERGKPGLLPQGQWWVPALSQDNLINPGMIYNDPNYGMLTSSSNLKANQRNWMDWLGPAFAAALTMGAGSLAGGLGAMTAVAGDAFLPGALYGAGAASTPWYLSTGLNVAKQLGADKPEAPKPQPVPTHPGTSIPFDYMPNMFGNASGTPTAAPTGNAPVATGIVPNAYENSNNYGFNQVVT